MSVTPTGNASSLAALYAALSASSTTTGSTVTTTTTGATSTTSSAPAASTAADASASSNATLTPESTLNQDIAAEQLSYLVSMQSTLQDDFLTTGIVSPQEGALLFGNDTSNPLGLVAPSSTSDDAVQSLIVTPGLSDLAIKVLTGQTSLESVVSAGTQAQQNVAATQVAAAYGASGSSNDPNADTDPDTGDDGDTDS